MSPRVVHPGFGFPRTVWPNEAVRAPDGVFPFEAVVIPQGFHPAVAPGRLEHVVHQSTRSYATGFTFPSDPNNSPRFYHRVLFVDMDGDDFYGAGTTQTALADPIGITISTIGQVVTRYDAAGPAGWTELFIPVFEGRDIHRLSFRPSPGSDKVSCPVDESLACGS